MIAVKIDYASDDSCQLQLWAKGTHAPEAFLSACEERLMLWDGRQVELAGKPVVHTHWRTVPADAAIKALGVCDNLHVESSPGRGAYAVTVLDEWLPIFHKKAMNRPAREESHV